MASASTAKILTATAAAVLVVFGTSTSAQQLRGASEGRTGGPIDPNITAELQVAVSSGYLCPACDRQCAANQANICSRSTSEPDWQQNGWCWGLCPEWQCRSGFQSPVSIPAGLPATGSLDLLGSARYQEVWGLTPVMVGHALKLKSDYFGTLRYDGEDYQAKSLHFHCPSEHPDLVGDTMVHYACEMHVVHESPGAVKRVVIALRYKLPDGNDATFGADPFLSQLGVPNVYEGVTNPGAASVTVDLSKVLSILSQGFYGYSGSLTTPPCTPNVQWFVAAAPLSISLYQWVNMKGSTLREDFRESHTLDGRAITKYSR